MLCIIVNLNYLAIIISCTNCIFIFTGPSMSRSYGFSRKKTLDHFEICRDGFFDPRTNPEKCSSRIVYAGMNASNAESTIKNSLEKYLEIKECEF